MSDAGSRNAKYLSLRFIKSLNELVRRDALSYQDIANVREGLFGKKMLVDFLIESTELALEKQINFTLQEWIEADIFFESISLSPNQRTQTKRLREELRRVSERFSAAHANTVESPQPLDKRQKSLGTSLRSM